ncbi:Internalin-A [Listeria weihenstephanensis FSL R9-0317]|nr:leucine-rich repeat domain-containing protein [Listeria weihenstephanensis]EUJ40103.1 Internalin-A [Listeria weihenstephanensis FSL R9-0317]
MGTYFPIQFWLKQSQLHLKKSPTDLVTKTQLTKFGSLVIKNQKVRDLTGLEYLTNITGLQLTNTDVADLTPISNITALKTITLTYNKIRDISPLKKLINTKNLQLQGNQISDIAVLSSLTNLTSLNLYSNQVSNISPLSMLAKATTFDLGLNRIQDVAPLARLTTLQSLQLNSNEIKDIEPLQNLTALSVLGLFANNISDITPLRNLVTLTSLDFTRNQITDISSLNQLTHLTYLKANENNIKDASIVRQFPELTYLNLADNELTNIIDLQNLVLLQQLNISGNHLTNLEPLKNLTNLISFFAINQQVTAPVTKLGESASVFLKDKDEQPLVIDTSAAYHLSDNFLVWDEAGKHQLTWQNNEGTFSGNLTQDVQKVTQVFLDDFMLGDKYITGIYSNPDVTQMSVQINQKVYYGGDVINHKLKFYIEGKITQATDVVIIKTYNKKSEVLETTELTVEQIPASIAKWKSANVLFLGDSITAGLRANIAYPNIVAKQLRFPTLQNEGISGATIAQNDASSVQSLVQQLEALDTSKITDVVIFGGTNDFYYETPMGTLNRSDKNTFYGALNTIAAKLKAQNKKIYFVTPMWRSRQLAGDGKDSDNFSNNNGVYLNDYATAIKNVAQKYQAPCLDLYSEKEMYDYSLIDGVHPNDEGQYFIGNEIAAWMNGDAANWK